MTSHFMQFSATTQLNVAAIGSQLAVWSAETMPVTSWSLRPALSADTSHWFTEHPVYQQSA